MRGDGGSFGRCISHLGPPPPSLTWLSSDEQFVPDEQKKKTSAIRVLVLHDRGFGYDQRDAAYDPPVDLSNEGTDGRLARKETECVLGL